MWILLLPGIGTLFDCKGWACALKAFGEAVPLSRLYFARLAGEAVNNLTPAGDIGGEPIKAYMLKTSGVPTDKVLASLIIARTALIASQILFILMGLPFFLHYHGLLLQGGIALLPLLGLAYLLVRLLIRLQKKGPFTLSIRGIKRARPILERWGKNLQSIDAVYDPERLPWPDLNGSALARLRAIPFWDEVLNTERAAGAKVSAYAATVGDPLLRDAIVLQGVEETRHARLLEFMTAHYGVTIGNQASIVLPGARERTFIDFGYGECLDAFLGFGVFQIARQAQFLPDALFTICDRLMEEETRHIVFFVNWMAYRQVSRGRGMRCLRALHSLWYYGRALYRLGRTVVRGAQHNGEDFSATQASVFLEGFNVTTFLTACIAENARRMSRFDQELLQPRLLPTFTRVTLSGLHRLPKRQSRSAKLHGR